VLTVSVVTAVYNRANTIADVMDSLSSQTYPHVEHVIQDGGSDDGTLDLIDRLKTPNTRVTSARDTGIYDAINKGIERATGDVIGLMHSDDVFASEQALSLVAEAFADPSVDAVYGDLNYVSAEDTNRIIRRWRSGSFTPEKLRKGWMPPHPTFYARRAVFEKWGLYDTGFRIAADYDAMLRYFTKGQIKVAYIPTVLVKMRVGGESNKSISKIIQKSREDYRAIRRNQVGGIGTLAYKNFSKLGQFLPGKGPSK
jgi:glycosyltransferase involved in cell wall biosynthesis